MNANVSSPIKRLSGCVPFVQLLPAIAMALIILFISYPLWFRILQPPPLEYDDVPYPVTNTPVVVGHPVLVKISRCNRTDEHLHVTYSREFIHAETGDRLVLPAGGMIIKPGCEVVTLQAAMAPMDMPTGEWILASISTVPSSGLRREAQATWYTQPFEVVAP